MKEDITVTDAQINIILARIGEELESKQIFEGGFINPIYYLTTKNGLNLVLRLTHTLPKWKHWKTQNEIVVMKFLRENTSIPTPKVYDCADTTELIGYEYILMERVEGITMRQWYPQATFQNPRGNRTVWSPCFQQTHFPLD